MSSDLFTTKNSSKKALSIKVSESTIERAEFINKELQQINPDIEFDLKGRLESKADELMAEAEKALIKLKKEFKPKKETPSLSQTSPP